MTTQFELDHVGVAVRDLNRAATAYRRLGFTLTERSWHMTDLGDGLRAPSGTGNHCIILSKGYVELIAPTDPSYSGRLLSDLKRYEGIHLIALGVSDAVAARDSIAEASGAPAQIRRLSRPFSERGLSFQAEFDIIDPTSGIDEAHVFAIKHLTPEAIWQSHLMHHPNGSTELREIVIVADDPERRAARLSRLFGATMENAAVQLANGRVAYLDPRGFAGRFPDTRPPASPAAAAMSIAVARLDETAAFLAAEGLIPTRSGDRLVLDAAEACGAIIEFFEGA